MLKHAAALLVLGTVFARGAGAQTDAPQPDPGQTAQEQTGLAESGLNAQPVQTFNTYEWVEQPRWTGRLGAVFLQRARPADTPYIVNNNAGNAPLVSPEGFDFPFQGGADVGLIRRGERADVEFRYFGVNDWTASQGPLLLPPGANIAVSGTGGGSPDPLTVSTDYASNLNSIEANLRRNVSADWTLLAGFRYLWLRDRMGLVAVNNVADETGIDFRTSNRLYGLQIGADGILWRNGRRFHVEGAIKAGLYGNNANSSVTLSDNSGPPFTAPASHAHAAFVGDTSFTGVYQINNNWAVRGGYQLLWLTGVAVAPEQLHVIDFNTGSVQTNVTHAAFFHGALVGVERSW